jgi:hypothetical protein
MHIVARKKDFVFYSSSGATMLNERTYTIQTVPWARLCNIQIVPWRAYAIQMVPWAWICYSNGSVGVNMLFKWFRGREYAIQMVPWAWICYSNGSVGAHITFKQWWANLNQASKDLDKTIFRDLSPTPYPEFWRCVETGTLFLGPHRKRSLKGLDNLLTVTTPNTQLLPRPRKMSLSS